MKTNLTVLVTFIISSHLRAEHLVCFTRNHADEESSKLAQREIYIDYQPREFASNIEVWADGHRTGIFVCEQFTTSSPFLSFDCGKETLQLDLPNNCGTMTLISEMKNDPVQQELICRREDKLKKF